MVSDTWPGCIDGTQRRGCLVPGDVSLGKFVLEKFLTPPITLSLSISALGLTREPGSYFLSGKKWRK